MLRDQLLELDTETEFLSAEWIALKAKCAELNAERVPLEAKCVKLEAESKNVSSECVELASKRVPLKSKHVSRESKRLQREAERLTFEAKRIKSGSENVQGNAERVQFLTMTHASHLLCGVLVIRWLSSPSGAVQTSAKTAWGAPFSEATERAEPDRLQGAPHSQGHRSPTRGGGRHSQSGDGDLRLDAADMAIKYTPSRPARSGWRLRRSAG